MIVAAAAVLLWEVAVSAVRIAWWPDEVDVFQELERDPVWKRRFEGIARGEERDVSSMDPRHGDRVTMPPW